MRWYDLGQTRHRIFGAQTGGEVIIRLLIFSIGTVLVFILAQHAAALFGLPILRSAWDSRTLAGSCLQRLCSMLVVACLLLLVGSEAIMSFARAARNTAAFSLPCEDPAAITRSAILQFAIMFQAPWIAMNAPFNKTWRNDMQDPISCKSMHLCFEERRANVL